MLDVVLTRDKKVVDRYENLKDIKILFNKVTKVPTLYSKTYLQN